MRRQARCWQANAAGAFATPTLPSKPMRRAPLLPRLLQALSAGPGRGGLQARQVLPRRFGQIAGVAARPAAGHARDPRLCGHPGLASLPEAHCLHKVGRVLRLQSRAYSTFVWLDHAQCTQRKEEQTTFVSMPAAGPPDQSHPRHQQRSACRCACRRQGAAQRGCPAACLRSALHQMS